VTALCGIVPLRAAPGLLNVYNNVNDAFIAQIFESDMQSLRIVTRDIYNRVITDLPPWTAIFKCDVYRRVGEDPSTTVLKQILRFARLMFLKEATRDDQQEMLM
jgi:hypothetical protein